MVLLFKRLTTWFTGKFPFSFCRQSLPDVLAIRNGVVPWNMNDRMIVTFVDKNVIFVAFWFKDVAVGSLWVTPIGALDRKSPGRIADCLADGGHGLENRTNSGGQNTKHSNSDYTQIPNVLIIGLGMVWYYNFGYPVRGTNTESGLKCLFCICINSCKAKLLLLLLPFYP